MTAQVYDVASVTFTLAGASNFGSVERIHLPNPDTIQRRSSGTSEVTLSVPAAPWRHFLFLLTPNRRGVTPYCLLRRVQYGGRKREVRTSTTRAHGASASGRTMSAPMDVTRFRDMPFDKVVEACIDEAGIRGYRLALDHVERMVRPGITDRALKEAIAKLRTEVQK